MYTYKIWNKTEGINGISSDIVLEKNPMYNNQEIVLIINSHSDRVEFIALESELRESYQDKISSIDELAKIRCSYHNENAPMGVVELQDKISTLEAGLANAEYAMMMGGLL